MTIRKAMLKDVDSIKQLVDEWSAKGQMLPRSLNELYENVRDFWVCEENAAVVGCAALHVAWADLAEIKSVAVKETEQKRGIGTTLVRSCLSEADEMGLKRVFALTYRQDFFEKNGFKVADKSLLPHKIWSECIKCPKFPGCDEIALVRDM